MISIRNYALAAVATSLVDNNPKTNESLEKHFLLQHLRTVDPLGKGWMTTLPSYLENPAPVDESLIRLSRILGLKVFEILAVAMASSVEEDIMAGRAIAYVQAPLGGSRPTLGLLANSLRDTADGNIHLLDEIVTGAAVQSSLLKIKGEGGPFPERTVYIPSPLSLALHGSDGAWPGAVIGLDDTSKVPLPSSILHEARRHAMGLQALSTHALVLRSGSGAEGRSLALAIAEALHLRPLFIETNNTEGLSPWLILRKLLPVFCLELAPGERRILPKLPLYRGPILALCGPDGSVEVGGGVAVSWSIPVPIMEERYKLWQIALNDSLIGEEFARNHRHRSGRIADLGRLAHHHSILRGNGRPQAEDVIQASRSGEGSGLEALAQPLPDDIPDEALVMTAALRRDLDALLLRCRYRDGLVEGLGKSATARYRPGVRALFVGISGTGKTLAAGWLATKLGLPLFRVDLAAVTSKYIGETEKNLAQLLARAEQSEVVLLFDEADSLFGQRTDVQQANDRFANAQTNYLLQRIESYDGITILTSNSRSRFDSAFSRRLDIIIDFPIPGPEERRALWQSHLGMNHSLSQSDLNRFAATADVNGGHIRNVVLSAATIAHKEKRPIGYFHIIEALIGEYRKLGRQMPIELKMKGEKQNSRNTQ
ncbi:MAG: ATP-binding protein [bacterium]